MLLFPVFYVLPILLIGPIPSLLLGRFNVNIGPIRICVSMRRLLNYTKLKTFYFVHHFF